MTDRVSPMSDPADVEQIAFEITNMARRLHTGRAPNPASVRARISYWMDGILTAISEASQTELICITLGEQDGRGLFKISSSPRADELAQDESIQELFKNWYRRSEMARTRALHFNGLPIFDDLNVPVILTEDLIQLFTHYNDSLPGIKDLPDLLQRHEESGPPVGIPDFYHQEGFALLRWLPSLTLDDAGFLNWVKSGLIQELVWIEHPETNAVGVNATMHWLMSKPFRFGNSKICLGGKLGVRLGALVLLRVAITIGILRNDLKEDELQNMRFLSPGAILIFASTWLLRFKEDVNMSTLELEKSKNDHRLSTLPQVPFDMLPATPTSRDAPPISPVEYTRDPIPLGQSALGSTQLGSIPLPQGSIQDSQPPGSEPSAPRSQAVPDRMSHVSSQAGASRRRETPLEGSPLIDEEPPAKRAKPSTDDTTRIKVERTPKTPGWKPKVKQTKATSVIDAASPGLADSEVLVVQPESEDDSHSKRKAGESSRPKRVVRKDRGDETGGSFTVPAAREPIWDALDAESNAASTVSARRRRANSQSAGHSSQGPAGQRGRNMNYLSPLSMPHQRKRARTYNSESDSDSVPYTQVLPRAKRTSRQATSRPSPAHVSPVPQKQPNNITPKAYTMPASLPPSSSQHVSTFPPTFVSDLKETLPQLSGSLVQGSSSTQSVVLQQPDIPQHDAREHDEPRAHVVDEEVEDVMLNQTKSGNVRSAIPPI
ncbi:hypothetical protein FRC11_009186 [Ceratobasidium sp. 423]|nr:hypothetical protein FRC11_009186 [Ceratobasidium sp. 423]